MTANAGVTSVWSRQRPGYMISGRHRRKAIQYIGAFYIRIPCQRNPRERRSHRNIFQLPEYLGKYFVPKLWCILQREREKVMMGFLDCACTSITGNCCCFPEQRDWATVMWLQLRLDCLWYSWLSSSLFKEPASFGASPPSPVSHFYILLAEPPLCS